MNSWSCSSKKKKMIGVLTLSFGMVLSLLAPSSIEAAKSPKLSKSQVNVSVGKTVTLKLKNVAKKAKVKWVSKSKKVAKITKSSKKSAKIKGVKAGKATIKVTYKVGKKSRTLSCKVVVKGKSTVKVTASPAPTPSPSATAAPNTPVPSNAPDVSASPDVPEQAYKWVTTWGTAEERCDATDSAMPKMALTDTTVRQIIRVTTGGNKLRLRLSNQYGKSDVEIQSLHLAKQIKADASTIDVSTDTAVTVNGEEEFIIPKGKVILTDEVEFPVDALENIAVSAYFGGAPKDNITGHRGARATTYQVSGNQVSEERFSSAKTTTSFINEGIGSNSILGSYPTDAGKDRFARDLLEHDGVEYCIILFGVNDITNLKETSKYDRLIPEYQKMIQLCHDNGIKVYGAPILPFGTSSSYTEASEEVRTMINDWMRSEDSGVDGIIDFESAVADPNNPKNILEKYTHEDGLHPYDGYSAMADAIDLSMFE